MKPTLLFLLAAFLLLALPASAQRTLSGKVTTQDGKPLAGVIVTVSAGEESAAFGNSGRDGTYKLTIPSEHARRPLTVSFRKLGYANETYELPAGATSLSAVMKPGDYTIREAIVKAPPVVQRGDTLRFNMAQFATGADASLEDGLKRIPGISVSESGAISYMGRDISQFYIEGLNLLGGRYSLATKNIPVDKVTGVEVLRHHQHNKVDKDELSSDVALNIKLSEKAKIKPFGTYEARAGVVNDRDPLYGLGGTGMLFRKNFQLLTTLKLSNDGRLGANKLTNHYGGTSWASGAKQALPLLSGSRPPFAEYRYKDKRNELLSLNALQKLTEDNQLKVNANYAHERTDYCYEVLSSYPTGSTLYETDERLDFLQRSHRVTADVEYRSNKDARLLENTFSLYGRFADAEGEAATGSELYRQAQEQDALGVRNAFSLVRKVRGWRVRINSDVQYAESPEGALSIRFGETETARQAARSRQFRTQERFYTGYEVLPGLTFALPVTLTLNAGSLRTDLEEDGAEAPSANDLRGWDLQLNAAPSLDYQTANRRLRIGADVPLKFLTEDYDNRLAGRRMDFTRCFADASLFFRLILNAKANLEGRTDWWHSYGDYFSLLGNPVRTDYRTLQARSGTFGTGRTSRTRLEYEWQSPLEFWFFNTSVSYTRSFNSVMSGQDVSGGDLSLTERLGENTGDNVYVDGKLSKYLLGPKTNLTLGGHWTWSRSQMLSSGSPMSAFGSGYGGYLEVRANPLRQLDVTYRGSVSLSVQHTPGRRSEYTDLGQRLSLTYLPLEALNLRAGAEWQRTTLSDGRHKSSLLLDARAEYKLPKKRIRLRLELNNLLDRRDYSYTVYNGLNAFTYHYRLRGREVLFSFIFM